jgi:hypothetical protein
VFNKRKIYWIKPIFNAFNWTLGFLKRKILIEIIKKKKIYPWKAAPNARLVNRRISELVSVELSKWISKSRPFISAKSMALSY